MNDETWKAMEKIAKQMEQLAKPLKDLDEHLKKALQESIRLPNFVIPAAPELAKIEIPPLPPNPNLASEFHKRLVTWINDFDRSLDQQYEVGIRLVNFGQVITFHLTDLEYWNPSLISFKGVTDSEEPVELIQHVTQISILLMKVKRKNPNEPKRPIGFAPWPGEPESDI